MARDLCNHKSRLQHPVRKTFAEMLGVSGMPVGSRVYTDLANVPHSLDICAVYYGPIAL